MTKRKRTTLTVVLTVVALVAVAGVAWATHVFPDVPDDDVHADAIQWAAENGIVEGYTNGNFGPYDEILRGQAATMFSRFNDYLMMNGGGGDLAGCLGCHDDSNMISGREAQWTLSAHGSGNSFLRGTSSSCAGCHDGGTFQSVVAEGTSPGSVENGSDNVGRQDCRTCHQIHQTGTSADWALETTAAVTFYATGFPGDVGLTETVYDGGTGNLCATCHQPRRTFPNTRDAAWTAGDPIPAGTISEHWGPHHGGQGSMLLGVAGAGADDFTASPHMGVENTCVTCHVRGGASHTFGFDRGAIDNADCEPCHSAVPSGAAIDALQAANQARLDAIGAELVALNLLSSADADGHPTVFAQENEVPYDQAVALWNWLYLAHEDGSLGVHNPGYYRALLDEAEAALGLGA